MRKEQASNKLLGWVILFGSMTGCCITEIFLTSNISELSDYIAPVAFGILGIMLTWRGVENLSE